MKQYLLPFGIYTLLIPFLAFFKVDSQTSYIVKSVVVFVLLIYFWKSYKIKYKFDFISILAGFLIFFVWIGLDKLFTPIYPIEFNPESFLMLLFKIFGFILVAPLMEEIFTRGFIIRLFSKEDYGKVPVGKFTWSSFIITVLFFGFSHNRWQVGIITGIILNLVYYKNKSVFGPLVSHFVANILLAIYIVHNGFWFLW